MTIYSDLRVLFVQQVLANHDLFLREIDRKVSGDYSEENAGANACTSFSHFAEHVFLEMNSKSLSCFNFKNSKEYKDYLKNICPEFRVVEAFCNIHKHRQLKDSSQVLKSIGQIIPYIEISTHKDEKGTFFNANKEIDIRLNDGTRGNLRESLQKVRSMWWSEMRRLGFFPEDPNEKPAPQECRKPVRESESGAAKLDLFIQKY